MLAYVDEYGNLSSTPPNQGSKRNANMPTAVEDLHKGIISRFNTEKRYGFITITQAGKAFFCMPQRRTMR